MSTLHNKYRNFLENNTGVAAVEFALIMPILILMTFGGYTSFDMIFTDRAVSRSSAIVTDLTTRSESVDDVYIQNLIEISKSLVGDAAQDDTRFDVSITSISNTFDSDADYELIVNWSFGNKSSVELTTGDIEDYDLPHIPEGESIILVDLSLRYQSDIFQDLFGLIELNEVSIGRPRFVTLVPYES